MPDEFEWGKEIITYSIAVPLIWWLLSNIKKMMEKMIDSNTKGFALLKDEFNRFYEVFKTHSIEDDQNFKIIQKEIAKAAGTVNLSNEQIIEISKARVWLTSEKKLDFIKKRLEKNNLKDRKDVIKKQVRTELERRSEEYISFLNSFVSPVGIIGEWVDKNFPMDDFIEEIYDVMFRDCKVGGEAECINQKINDCRFIMSAYQNELWQKLKLELNS